MFEHALFKARELAERYEEYAQVDDLRKCEKRFLWNCDDFLDKKIEILNLPDDIPSSAMAGTFLRLKNGSYVILLNPGLTPQWRRFVLCKELFHVIMDEEKVWSLNLAEHLDQTLFVKVNGAYQATAQSEFAAYAAAAEFLFPYSKRVWLIEIGRGSDLKGNAAQFDIPEPVVDFFMAPKALELYLPPGY